MNRVLRLRATFGWFFLTVAIASEARSELITFEFSGTVTSVSINSADYQGFDFPDVGDPFIGFYTFDSNAQDTADSPTRWVPLLACPAVLD